MKIYTDCVPCFFEQTNSALKMINASQEVEREVFRKVAQEVAKLDFSESPPYMGMVIHRIIREVTKNRDPYKEIKKKYNILAKHMYKDLKEIVESSKDPLLTSLKISISGNIIDFGVSRRDIDLKKTLSETLRNDIAIDHSDELFFELESAKSLLYLFDNAGEILFDRVFIEEIRKNYKVDIYGVVKSHPVINDATLEDAIFCGLDEVCTLVENGTDAPGTLLKFCSEAFLRLFCSADVIISKGQGNYESLNDEGKGIFFLLKVKCPVCARDTGANVGDTIVLRR